MIDSANLGGEPGSKTDEPSTDINNPENWNFAEPDDEDDQANQDVHGDDGIESEPDEADEIGQETEEPAEADDESEDEPEGEEPTNVNDLDEQLVTLKGGEQVPVKELRSGYMRERDYRLKTQDVANRGRALEDMSNRVATTAHQIAQFLASNLPEEPSPHLAMTDPGEYTRKKAMFDVAMSNVNKILQMSGEPKQVVQQLTEAQRNELLFAENAKLTEAFPEIAKPEGRQKFFEKAFETGRNLGFTDDEMKAFTDHRYLKVIHYANMGLAAEKAKKTALQKVNNAPAAVPKGKPQGQNAAQVRKNQDAMKRLGRTGSIKDAMAIDFD